MNHPAQRRGTASARTLDLRKIVLGSVLTLGVGTLIAFSFTQPHAATSAGSAPATSLAEPRQSFADLVEKVRPAVVNVSTVSRATPASAQGLPFELPEGSPFAEQFREFFQRRFQGQPGQEARGVGSGFFIDARGHLVTNHHVVSGADEIRITMHDGTELEATVVGHDDKTDLAVLKVDHDGDLPFVAFGSSDAARVGDWVVAMGSPFGLGGTVTAGIISARGRDIRSGPFDDFLQVDAPINRGNSGGPLFDQSGQVIGVNTAIFSPSGGSVGIGFAIPAELASSVVGALVEDGRVQRGWMGVNIQGLSPDLAQSFGLDRPRGALVAGVLEGSPASNAGVRVGDVIVQFGEEEIDTMRELPRVVAAARAGSSVDVVVFRDGKQRSLTLQVGDMPGEERVAAASAPPAAESQGKLGVRLAPLDASARERLGLEEDAPGVLIAEVKPGSAAAQQGLRPGDVILRVGNQPVRGPGQISEAVRGAESADRASIVLLVSRNGNERFVAVPFERG